MAYSGPMIDWFTGHVGYDSSQLEMGKFMILDGKGELVRIRDAWETVKGSHATGIQITRSAVTSDMLAWDPSCPLSVLKVSGNPSKFLQGHNVAGPSVADLGPVMQAVVRAFGDGLRPLDVDKPGLAAVQRSRVDVTTSCWVLNGGRGIDHAAVHEWLHEAARSTRSRHGRAIDAGSTGTVYWGKHSTRWALKAYCKHCELKAHPPEGIDDALMAELLSWTKGQLRIELTLRRPELKTRDQLDESIIWEYFARVEGLGMRHVTDLNSLNLNNPSKIALQLWYDGKDLPSLYPKNTFYRHRRAILEATGIDISLPHDEQSSKAGRVLDDMETLRRNEVQEGELPQRIQRSLFGARL